MSLSLYYYADAMHGLTVYQITRDHMNLGLQLRFREGGQLFVLNETLGPHWRKASYVTTRTVHLRFRDLRRLGVKPSVAMNLIKDFV